MKKGIVVRLYPTREQEKIINQTFGCVRLIYNTLLDYAKENKEYNRFNLQKLMKRINISVAASRECLFF